MNTLVEVKVYGRGAEAAVEKAFERISQIETLMSTTLPDSEISRVNAQAGLRPVQVSRETFAVVAEALQYAHLTRGAFDPTVGPLVAAWNISGDSPRVPDKDELQQLIALVDWRQVQLDEEALSLFLPRKGMALDLGAIAKGYAADEAARVLKDSGIGSAYLNLGGNVYVIGAKPDGSPWRIGIRDPFAETENSVVGVVSAVDTSLVTSGTYERYFVQDGVKYHHILDPHTGYPAVSDLASVTIISDSSMKADGLSTSVFVLGRKRGRALIESIPDVEAVLVDHNRKVWVSPGLRNQFQIAEGFVLEPSGSKETAHDEERR